VSIDWLAALAGLFTCQPAFFTAAEVTGGNALFHIVVDNVDTATRLIQAFNQSNVSSRSPQLLAHPQLLVRSVVVLTIIPNVRHLDIV
jgi:chromosome segregation ATPase